jgi:hypothetical protein
LERPASSGVRNDKIQPIDLTDVSLSPRYCNLPDLQWVGAPMWDQEIYFLAFGGTEPYLWIGGEKYQICQDEGFR